MSRPMHRLVDEKVAVCLGWTPLFWAPNILWRNTKGQIRRLPHFSTDLAYAGVLLESLRSSGLYCCIDLLADYCYTWTIKTTSADRRKNPDHKGVVQYDGEFELPLAMCITFCKVHGIDIRTTLGRPLWLALYDENEKRVVAKNK